MAKGRRPRNKDWRVRLGEEPSLQRCLLLGGTVREVVDRDATGKILVLRHRLKVECMLDAYLIRDLIAKEEHQAGMKYRVAWLRARGGIRVRDRFTSGKAMYCADSMCVVSDSERILKEADEVLTPTQKLLIINVCVENKKAGGTDKIETLYRGLNRLAKRWGYR